MFAERKWARLKNARITCLDYTYICWRRPRSGCAGYSHIQCVQGDVGKLQMAGEAFDLVVSMNGFHAFPDKQKAFGETWRVLKPGGRFIACFYIWESPDGRTGW
ncbi:MAG: class I SAM-dependent methyltransferase [Oscillospiraceae bacterium]